MAEWLDELREDMTDAEVELGRIRTLGEGVGHSVTRALRGAVLEGKSLNGVLADVARSFSEIALRAALKPLGDLTSGLVEQLFSAANPAVRAFAKGGVISAPSYFPMGGGLGLAGEAGPEAIVPLRRGPDGSLGVASSGGGAVNVTFNVTASDARSFVAAEAEVGAMLLRAVRRGARGS
jgi:phage-related minor tail protein